MRRYTLRAVLGAVLAVGLAACGAAAAGEPTAHPPTHPTQAEIKLYVDTVHYDNAVVLNQTEAWNDASWGQGLLLLELNYVPPAPPPRPVTPAAHPTAPMHPAPAAGNVGGACGGATNGADQFIGRESGGNPNARNASGAWGCYQIMPGTWASSCSDLGTHGSATVSAQAQCASRLPSSSWTCCEGKP